MTYCVTDQPSITWSRRSDLTFEHWAALWAMITEQLYEQWSKSVHSEKISTPIYVKCYKMYWSRVCVQKFWYFVPCLDVQPGQSKNDNPACKKEVAGCETVRVIYCFFCRLTWTCGLAVKVSCYEWGNSGSIPAGFWNLLLLVILHWASQCTDTSAFILLLSL